MAVIDTYVDGQHLTEAVVRLLLCCCLGESWMLMGTGDT
jgi:hypothetical protein